LLLTARKGAMLRAYGMFSLITRNYVVDAFADAYHDSRELVMPRAGFYSSFERRGMTAPSFISTALDYVQKLPTMGDLFGFLRAYPAYFNTFVRYIERNSKEESAPAANDKKKLKAGAAQEEEEAEEVGGENEAAVQLLATWFPLLRPVQPHSQRRLKNYICMGTAARRGGHRGVYCCGGSGQGGGVGTSAGTWRCSAQKRRHRQKKIDSMLSSLSRVCTL
uniref:TENA_THI-4 domain-containing protein n=1 Tax=Gongylonema pulchrum TaxID=637853 RepID=A0A183ED09_9BILA